MRILLPPAVFVVIIDSTMMNVSIGSGTGALSLVPGLLLMGVGLGFQMSQLNNLILSSLPVEQASEAGGRHSSATCASSPAPSSKRCSRRPTCRSTPAFSDDLAARGVAVGPSEDPLHDPTWIRALAAAYAERPPRIGP